VADFCRKAPFPHVNSIDYVEESMRIVRALTRPATRLQLEMASDRTTRNRKTSVQVQTGPQIPSDSYEPGAPNLELNNDSREPVEGLFLHGHLSS
jgi:hypothetical protein